MAESVVSPVAGGKVPLGVASVPRLGVSLCALQQLKTRVKPSTITAVVCEELILPATASEEGGCSFAEHLFRKHARRGTGLAAARATTESKQLVGEVWQNDTAVLFDSVSLALRRNEK